MRLYIMKKERRVGAFIRSFIYLFIHSKLQAEYVLPHRHLHISSSKNKQLHKIQLLCHHNRGAAEYNELLVNQSECQCRIVSSLPAMFITFCSHGCRKSVITSRTRFLALCMWIPRLIPLKEGTDLPPEAERRHAAPSSPHHADRVMHLPVSLRETTNVLYDPDQFGSLRIQNPSSAFLWYNIGWTYQNHLPWHRRILWTRAVSVLRYQNTKITKVAESKNISCMHYVQQMTDVHEQGHAMPMLHIACTEVPVNVKLSFWFN
jgi:hypothetical protein